MASAKKDKEKAPVPALVHDVEFPPALLENDAAPAPDAAPEIEKDPPPPSPAPASSTPVVSPAPAPAAPRRVLVARYRVIGSGTLQRNGTTYAAGDEVSMPPGEGDAMTWCLERCD